MRRGGTWTLVTTSDGVLVVATTLLIVGFGLLAAVLAMRSEPLQEPVSDRETEVVLAAGDIGDCSTDHDRLVADVIDNQQGTVLTLGDHAYPAGRHEDFEECYDPTWGRHRWRTRPAPGNHDYQNGRFEPYHSYFGEKAGEPRKGYYGYEIGSYWYAIALNTNCDHVPGGCDAGSAQVRWLERELEEHADRNILAYWHHPVLSTGEHGSSTRGAAIFEALYDAEADLVLVAHDHNYERFARVNPAGRRDDMSGIRQFVVGTGGGELRPFAFHPLASTEVRDAGSHGVLQVTLERESYRWRFLPAAGSSFTDEGSSPINGTVPAARRREGDR